MTENVFIVWKIPEHSIDEGEFPEVGIYPTGELMSVSKTRSEAEKHVSLLENSSPSERFGETMDDAPYRFIITGRELAG